MNFKIDFASADEVKLVLDALGQQPYARVASLAQSIVNQAMAQESEAENSRDEAYTAAIKNKLSEPTPEMTQSGVKTFGEWLAANGGLLPTDALLPDLVGSVFGAMIAPKPNSTP